MNLEKEVMNWLKNNWTLTDPKKENITWTFSDWRVAEEPLFKKSRIVVTHIDKVLENRPTEFYRATALVKVVVVAERLQEFENANETKWNMISEVKRIVESASKPENWDLVEVERIVNTNVEEVGLPVVLEEEIYLRINRFWSET